MRDCCPNTRTHTHTHIYEYGIMVKVFVNGLVFNPRLSHTKDSKNVT